MAAVGHLLAAALVALRGVDAVRLRRAVRRLRGERFLPSDDRAYLRGQVVRRSLVAVVLVLIGGLIEGYYLSGMDDRMNALGAGRVVGDGDGDGNDPAAPAERTPEDKAFAKFVAVYWSVILGLVFVIACLALFDFWATRRYWMAQYKLIKADHEAKLHRDLAVYRQAKENDRMHRLRRDPGTDDTDEHPPVE